MDYNQYIKSVKERASFTKDDDVIKAVRAVLEVLGERLSGGQATGLAALLPKELKPYLQKTGEAQSFGVNEFLARVGVKEGVDPTIARYHSQAALSVLAGAVPTSGLIDALAELPMEIRDLFLVENWAKKAA